MKGKEGESNFWWIIYLKLSMLLVTENGRGEEKRGVPHTQSVAKEPILSVMHCAIYWLIKHKL